MVCDVGWLRFVLVVARVLPWRLRPSEPLQSPKKARSPWYLWCRPNAALLRAGRPQRANGSVSRDERVWERKAADKVIGRLGEQGGVALGPLQPGSRRQ